MFFSCFWKFSKGLTSVSQPGAATVAQRVGPGTFCSSILLCRERPADFSFLPGIFHNLLPQGIFSSQSSYLGRSYASPDFKKKSGTWAWTSVHSFLGPFDWFKMVKWSNQGQDTTVFLLSILGEEVSILSTGPELLADILMPCKIKSWKVDPKKSDCDVNWIPATISKLKLAALQPFSRKLLTSVKFSLQQRMELFDWQGSEVVSGSESSLKLMSTNIPALPVSLSPSLRLSDSFPSHQGSFRFHLYIYYYHMTQKSIFRVYSNGIESPLVRYLCFHIHQVSFELFWQLLSLRCLSKEFKTSPEGPWLLLPTKLFAFHFSQGYPLLSELHTAVQRNLVNEGRWAGSRLCQGQLTFPNSPSGEAKRLSL